jgi:hypothetical protein
MVKPTRIDDGQAGVTCHGPDVEQHPKPEVGPADTDGPSGHVPQWPVHGQLRPVIIQDQRQVGLAAGVMLWARLLKAT